MNYWLKSTSQETYKWIKNGEGHDVGRGGVVSQFGEPSVAVNPPAPAWPPADTTSLGDDL